MSTQPEALRLAEVSPYLEGGERGQWIIDAAAELRRLQALLEAEQALHQRVTYPELQRLRAQRDALLEACRAMLTFIERHAPRGLQPEPGSPVAMARSAIKAVEEQK